MEILKEYIIEQALVIIPVLIFIGWVLKNTPSVKDWLIPYILLPIGVVFGLFLVGFNVDGVIQGVLVTAGAVLGHQLYVQAKERD